MSVLVFASCDFELGRTWLAGGVDRQSHTGLIFFISVLSDVAGRYITAGCG